MDKHSEQASKQGWMVIILCNFIKLDVAAVRQLVRFIMCRYEYYVCGSWGENKWTWFQEVYTAKARFSCCTNGEDYRVLRSCVHANSCHVAVVTNR